jgi:hypothetical protein
MHPSFDFSVNDPPLMHPSFDFSVNDPPLMHPSFDASVLSLALSLYLSHSLMPLMPAEAGASMRRNYK